MTSKPNYDQLEDEGGCKDRSTCTVSLGFTTCYYLSSSNCESTIAEKFEEFGNDDDDAYDRSAYLEFLSEYDCPNDKTSGLLEISPDPITFTSTVGTKYVKFRAKSVGTYYGCWFVIYNVTGQQAKRQSTTPLFTILLFTGSAEKHYDTPPLDYLYVTRSGNNPSGPNLYSAQFSNSGVYIYIVLDGNSDQLEVCICVY